MCHSEKAANRSDRREWSRPLRDGLDFIGRRTNFPTLDDVPEIFDLRLEVEGLGGLDKELVLLESFENLTQMLRVLVFCLAVDHDIVQVNYYEVACKIPENIVHHSLKSRGSVCQTEWHYHKFVVPIWGTKRRLLPIFFFDRDVVIAI